MSTTLRTTPVVDFNVRPEPGPLKQTLDVLGSVLGKLTAFASVTLLAEVGGVTLTNAAVSPGTDVPEARTQLNLGDANANSARVVVRGKNSAAGAVTLEVYRVGLATLCSVPVGNNTLATFVGEWTAYQPTGQDEEIGIRVVGDGAFDPVLYRVELQLRTTRWVG